MVGVVLLPEKDPFLGSLRSQQQPEQSLEGAVNRFCPPFPLSIYLFGTVAHLAWNSLVDLVDLEL